MLLLAATLHAAPGESSVELPWAAGTHVRTTPTWDGHRVLVAPRVATLDGNGRQLRATPALPTYTEALPATLSVDDALDLARALAGRPLGMVTVEQAWLPRGRTLHPVYGLEAAVGHLTNRWQLWYDARTGELLTLGPAVRTALGSVYPDNPLESDPIDVELGVEGTLSSEFAVPWSCALVAEAEGIFEVGSCEELEQLATPDEEGNFLFEPAPSAFDDPFAEVHLFHHVDLMGQWLDDEHGLHVGQPLLVAANLDMTNAFYGDLDGDGRADLAFGQSPDGVDFGYDADVAYHELGHGVVARTAGLGFMRADEYGMDWSPGSLNEGVADVFSILLGGDAEMAEYAGTHSGRSGPIRDLNEDRRCPDDLCGEVHADGEILGAMAWNMVQDSRLGSEVVAQLFMASLPTWGTNTTWTKAGEKLAASATDLANELVIGTEQELAVVEHLEAANLPDCGRVTDLSDGQPRSLYLPNLGLVDDYELVPAGTGFSVDVPEDATSLTIRLEDWDPGDAEGLGWTLMTRQDTHVEHEIIGLDALGLSYATPVTYDQAFEGSSDFELVLDADSTPALEPGRTLYLALAGRNDGGLTPLDLVYGKVSFSAVYSRYRPRVEPSCACSGGAAGGWLLVPLLALARRRR